VTTRWVVFVLLAGTTLAGCIRGKCFENADCESPRVCNVEGECVFACSSDTDCPGGFTCVDRQCQPKSVGPVSCPADMVVVAEAFCIDRYEASRPDSTATSFGSDETGARSAKDVLPWRDIGNSEAERACEAAGKRLCTPDEWRIACRGPADTTYAYGSMYHPTICNGIDAFGRSQFHLMPTGAFPQCTNGWGVFDINGNVWEHTAAGSARTVRGGAYNCGDSAALHKCDYVPGTWEPSAIGFRCCLTPTGVESPDAGTADPADAAEHADAAQTPDAGEPSDASGCVLEEDAGEPPPDAGLPADAAVIEGRDAELSQLDAAAEIVDAGTEEVDAGLETVDAALEMLDAAVESADAAVDAVDAGEGADAGPPAPCPPDMVETTSGCIDRYEASREDATATAQGISTVPTSRPGVRPWSPIDLEPARAACLSVGKRLCRPDEWVIACQGPDLTVYSYGNTYEPATCNGIDAFCNCSSTSCSPQEPVCPYAGCYWTCGATFHVAPSGSFSGCASPLGVFDLNGNLWEVVDTGTTATVARGGAYNCGDSQALHRCDYDTSNPAQWPNPPPARGFRCCKEKAQ